MPYICAGFSECSFSKENAHSVFQHIPAILKGSDRQHYVYFTEQNIAKTPNKMLPTRRTNYCQNAEQNVANSPNSVYIECEETEDEGI